MVEHQRSCQQLILLVGSNPLPNFFTALVLKPESVLFLYSPETEQVKDNLKQKIQAKHPNVSLEEMCIENATNAAGVRSVLTSIHDGAHLHYTGGTKIMAAHARIAFLNAGGGDDHASYLDERRGVLLFDDGYEIDLASQNIILTIDDILELHGIERMVPKDEKPQSTHLPTDPDAAAVAKAVLGDPDLADKLYNFHRKNGKRCSFNVAKENPIPLSESVDGFSASQLPEKEWNKKTYEKWCDFLGGGWLEAWCGNSAQTIVSDAEVAVGVDCKLKDRQIEIDLTIVRGHRLYVISCTTHTKIGLCKSKLFEVALRARQLGGDLARSALVSLLHGADSRGAFVDQLRNDVADIWDAPNTPRVFGLDDLKEWMGTDGRPNADSLREWLDS